MGRILAHQQVSGDHTHLGCLCHFNRYAELACVGGRTWWMQGAYVGRLAAWPPLPKNKARFLAPLPPFPRPYWFSHLENGRHWAGGPAGDKQTVLINVLGFDQMQVADAGPDAEPERAAKKPRQELEGQSGSLGPQPGCPDTPSPAARARAGATHDGHDPLSAALLSVICTSPPAQASALLAQALESGCGPLPPCSTDPVCMAPGPDLLKLLLAPGAGCCHLAAWPLR